MKDIYTIKNVIAYAQTFLKNISKRIFNTEKSDDINRVNEIKEFYYFKNINECVKFIDTNSYELTKNRNIKCLSINLHFINSDNEIEIKNIGVLKKPFVKIKKKINRNVVKITSRYIPVKIKFLRLQIKFKTSAT